jgi:MFS transporter, AAHS family, 3-hydroxyphenylpropionic acid transporter
MKSPDWAVVTASLCVMAAVCEGVDLQAAGVAAAGIIAEFKPRPEQLGTFFSASTVGLLLGALLGGWLSDRHGRKRILVGSVAAFGVFSIVTVFARDIEQLSWARLLTGFGLGGAMPNLLALVTELSPERSKRANLTFVYAAMPLGGALVSLIAMLVPRDGWRIMFVAGGILPLITAPLMARFLQESSDFAHLRAQTHGEGSSRRAGLGEVIGEVIGGGRALASVLLWASFFLGLLTLYLLLNWLPTLMIGRGTSASWAAAAQIAFNAGGAAAAVMLGRFLDGEHRLIAVVFTLICTPLLVWMLAVTQSQGAGVLAIVLALGCAVLALQAFLNATAPMIYPAAVRGLGVGAAVAMGRLGSVVGPKLGGAWKAAGLDTSQLLLKLLPIVVLASAAALGLALVADRLRARIPTGKS